MHPSISGQFLQANENRLGRLDVRDVRIEGNRPVADITSHYMNNHGNVVGQNITLSKSRIEEMAQQAMFDTGNPYYRPNINQLSQALVQMNNMEASMAAGRDPVGDLLRRTNIPAAAPAVSNAAVMSPNFFQ